MKQLNPYINFGGRCKEAMSYYQICFGGELSLMTVGESPEPCEENKDGAALIMHASLPLPGGTLMATDMGGPEKVGPQDQIAVCIDCSSLEEIERLFAQLSEGGQVFQPLIDAFWGGKFGVTLDKFGVTWMFNFTIGD